LLDGYRIELIETGVVRYPASVSHSSHATARRFMRGCETVISFDVRARAEDVGDLGSDIEAALSATRPS
jgi:cystathionine beta-lyase/cystathionine gamma-synthase